MYYCKRHCSYIESLVVVVVLLVLGGVAAVEELVERVAAQTDAVAYTEHPNTDAHVALVR